ncbi:DUF2852 domain-containing protein [Roseomonas sp. CECT 9278]|uniref:DUF2852 domain-containing protein n=1 Tax=Roseomonas sp. CECT 9278 TaxID=2845823 RepID=UPI001E4EA2E6|nr:DUF2852 domain-containing protein [Roseomonas sp. CECT 9278]CAH0298199.1 hypothetical protein ROS9278_04454 [Roseomonas sp. CECT 9278]
MSATAYPPDDAAFPSRRERREQRRERRWREEGRGEFNASRWSPWTAPKPVMIAVMILAFILFFPVGLLILGFMIGSGRLGRRWAHRYGMGPEAGRGWCSRGDGRRDGSGNIAFDEYRVDTLRRLEEEQKDFAAFLERLRFAKDRSEFEQFMTDRRSRPAAPPAEGERPAQG